MESAYRDWGRQRERPRGRAATGRRGTKVALGGKERRRLGQLVVCLALFLVVFIGKGVFPEQMMTLRDQIAGMVSGDTDFKAAFANLGKSISSGAPVTETLGELWVDVFGGGTVVEVWQPTELFLAHRGVIHTVPTGGAVLEAIGVERKPSESIEEEASAPEPEPTPNTDTEAAPEVPPEPAVVHVDYDGPAMPANATMDWYSLGLAQTISPVEGAEGSWISSDYGWREHPVYGDDRFHNGVDLAVNHGTGVKCFADGVVDYIGESPVYGLYTQVKHDNGVTSFYAHCSELLVQQGQMVKMGDVIAMSGETGNVTGPHLHFELKKDGILLNPCYYIGTD